MNRLTLHTVERDSILTRLDFRSKLFLMVVVTTLAFLWESPLLNGLLALVMVVVSVVVGVRIAYLRSLITLMLPVFLLVLLSQSFFAGSFIAARGGDTTTPLLELPERWWLIGGLRLTLEGLLYGVAIIFKTLTLALVLPLGIFTTDVNSMVVGLVQMRVPYTLAFIFSSTLRFFPLLLEEMETIIEAQRLRGLAFEEMGILRRWGVYARIAVPLILGTLVKSQKLDVVLQAKAFSASPDRTYLHESKLRSSDYLLIILSALALVGALIAYVVWGVGRFLGPL